MGFWLFMLLSDLLIPVIMLGLGCYFATHSPKKINYFVGYRTTRSMKNLDTWQFAHHYWGKLWRTVGLILLAVSIIPFLFVINADADTLGAVGTIVMIVQLAGLITSIIPVEIKLKNTFDENGMRKN
jgi:uncharacterized membrane protein